MRFWELTGTRRRWVQATITAGALVVSVATAAQASAATLTVNKTCYVNKFSKTRIRQAQMMVTGTGYVPGDSVTVTSSDGSINQVLQAGPTGAISGTIGAPTPFFKLPSSEPVGLIADDYAPTGTIQGGAFIKVTDLQVATVPGSAPPSRRVTWYFSGFTTGRYIYGHYVRHGRQVARARFGRAKGVCGLLRTRARFFPGHQRYASYGLQFDNARRYSKHSTPRIVTSLGPR
jgi:hypothetical protein